MQKQKKGMSRMVSLVWSMMMMILMLMIVPIVVDSKKMVGTTKGRTVNSNNNDNETTIYSIINNKNSSSAMKIAEPIPPLSSELVIPSVGGAGGEQGDSKQQQHPSNTKHPETSASSEQQQQQQQQQQQEMLVVDLPWGDINVMILTDTHSWVGGHGMKQPELNVDYGSVVSFYEQLQKYCIHTNRTFFFVMNGDWVDGTGLAMNGDPSYLIPILQKMPWDAINVGNHELYRNEIIQYILRPGGFVEFWQGRYLSSNVVRSNNSKKPLGSNYRILHGIHHSVLTFGFLFNMQGNADLVTVKQVETVLQEDWFIHALHHEKFDAIIVLAHMGFGDPLLQTILFKIRKELDDHIPVQFVTGHTHIRNFTMLDDASSSMEAGRFLDTIGFVSFPSKSTYTGNMHTTTTSNNNDVFQHKYIDANIDNLQKILGVSSLDTENGVALSQFITQVRSDLNLDQMISCLEGGTLYIDRSLSDYDSLWRFFREEVIPVTFPNQNVAVFMNKGSWRYDLLDGHIRMDDIIGVSPYNYSYVVWQNIPGSILIELNRSMNEHPALNYLVHLPNYILSVTPNTYSMIDENITYDLIMQMYEAKGMQANLDAIYPEAAGMKPVPLNHTTTSIWMDYFRDRTTCVIISNNDKEDQSHYYKSKYNSTVLNKSHYDSSKNNIPLWTVVGILGIATILVFIRNGHHTWNHTNTVHHQLQNMEALPQDNQGGIHDEDLDEMNEFI